MIQTIVSREEKYVGTYGQEEINDHLHICIHLDTSYKEKVYTLNMYDLKHDFELFLKNQLALYLSKDDFVSEIYCEYY